MKKFGRKSRSAKYGQNRKIKKKHRKNTIFEKSFFGDFSTTIGSLVLRFRRVSGNWILFDNFRFFLVRTFVTLSSGFRTIFVRNLGRIRRIFPH